jgi:hypothetical protein
MAELVVVLSSVTRKDPNMKLHKVPPPPAPSEALPAVSDSQSHPEIKFLQITLKGAAAQNQETLQKILAHLNQHSEGEGPSTSEGPSELEVSADEMQSVAERFVKLIRDSAHAGKGGQLSALNQWVIRDRGVSKMSDLVAASGVASNHAYAGIAGGLQKNMKKSGGPQQVAIGSPVWPANWYGWEKLGADDYLCTIDEDFVTHLTRALAEHVNLPGGEGPGTEQLDDPN